MKRFVGILAVAAVPYTSIHAEVEKKIGAEFDISYKHKSGNGEKDSKAEGGFTQEKMDLFFHFKADKLKAKVQFDVLSPSIEAKSTATGPDGNGKISVETKVGMKKAMIDDGWIEYAFDPLFALKLGIEQPKSNLYGEFTELYKPTRYQADDYGAVRMEFNGKSGDISYALQFWDDVAADQTKDDLDSGLGTNMAVFGKYSTEMLEAGVAYKLNAGYKDDSADEVKETKDVSAYQLFAKYSLVEQGLSFWLQYNQNELDEDYEGNTSAIFGLSYGVNENVETHFSVNAVTTKSKKDDDADESKSGNIIQLVAKYKMTDELSYFAQVVNYGGNTYGKDKKGEESVNQIGLGLQGRF